MIQGIKRQTRSKDFHEITRTIKLSIRGEGIRSHQREQRVHVSTKSSNKLGIIK
jgi:hypothetical protein